MNGLFVNIIPENDNEDDYRRIVDDHFTQLFGYKKSPHEVTFNKELLKRGSPCLRTYTSFLMVFWTLFMMTSIDYLLFYYQTTVRRCVIPELEGYNFSDAEINMLGGNPGYQSNCEYIKRNYTELLIVSNYSMPGMLKIVKIDKKENHQKIRCGKLFTYSLTKSEPIAQEKVSQADYYNFFCVSDGLMYSFTHIEYFGAIILIPVSCVMADMYGRKLMFIVNYGISFVCIVSLYIPNMYVLVIVKIFSSTMTCCLPMLLLIIFIEDCSLISRHLFGFIVFVANPISAILAHLFLQKTRVYVIRLSMALILLLSHLFILWYYQESARWVFYTGRKQKAWGMITVPAKYPANIRDQLNKKHINLCKQLGLFLKFIYRLRTLRHCFLMFGEMLLVNERRIRPYPGSTEPQWPTYLTWKVTMALLIVLVHVALLFVGQRAVLISIHVAIVMAVSTSMFHTEWEWLQAASAAFQESAADVCYYLLLYQSMELYPTAQRATAMGLSLASAYCSRLCNVLLVQKLERQSMALVTVIICTVVAAFLPETYHRDLPDLPREPLSSRFVNVC